MVANYGCMGSTRRSFNIYAVQTSFTSESAHSRTLVAAGAEDYVPISRYAVRELSLINDIIVVGLLISMQ